MIQFILKRHALSDPQVDKMETVANRNILDHVKVTNLHQWRVVFAMLGVPIITEQFVGPFFCPNAGKN
ncbi:major facilitator superfamily protein [Anopheles sinensis]|uniref:Major facilitator superfamily protein n=1 Tax=Anopheles sinensis TaxID=74873 RepID=A0A084WAC1_ANOSI|nr:major facilitator superfamily protein [Anopheles sinensis]